MPHRVVQIVRKASFAFSEHNPGRLDSRRGSRWRQALAGRLRELRRSPNGRRLVRGWIHSMSQAIAVRATLGPTHLQAFLALDHRMLVAAPLAPASSRGTSQVQRAQVNTGSGSQSPS